ncbi:hypothetical protein [Saccharopolyspora rosea]|uniref:WXG100 family type VII secretion target n=1 Tax=Saccharopolyspora rosea TaxID=524884 RepID=A0ABW3G0X1_9PSEU|nr:hypothetical protein [Saccharopolyspora rosea]
MVDLTALTLLRAERLAEFANAWNDVHNNFLEYHAFFADKVLEPLQEGHWRGAAADAAKQKCRRILDDIAAVMKEVESARTFIEEKSNQLKGLRDELGTITREAGEHGLNIVADNGEGTWAVMPAARGPMSPEQAAAATEFGKRVKAVLDAAADIDDEMTYSLKVIFGTTDNFETENRDTKHDSTWTDGDEVTEQKLRGGILWARHNRWDNAANLTEHYLSATGEPYEVNPAAMLNDIPQFKRDVDGTLSNIRSQPDGTFSTAWTSTAPNLDDDTRGNLDWYYALNHFQYRLVGEKQGGEITYHVEVKKRYDFGTPSEHRRDFDGPIPPLTHIEQADAAYLNTTGKAKDFDVHGRSNEMKATG